MFRVDVILAMAKIKYNIPNNLGNPWSGHSSWTNSWVQGSLLYAVPASNTDRVLLSNVGYIRHEQPWWVKNHPHVTTYLQCVFYVEMSSSYYLLVSILLQDISRIECQLSKQDRIKQISELQSRTRHLVLVMVLYINISSGIWCYLECYIIIFRVLFIHIWGVTC